MAIYQDPGKSISRREIMRSLGAFSVDELIEMKEDLKDKVSGNIHLESESELGRSSSSILLQNPTESLDCVMFLLNKLGRLTTEERMIWKSSRPKTSVRLLLNPLTRRGQV